MRIQHVLHDGVDMMMDTYAVDRGDLHDGIHMHGKNMHATLGRSGRST